MCFLSNFSHGRTEIYVGQNNEACRLGSAGDVPAGLPTKELTVKENSACFRKRDAYRTPKRIDSSDYQNHWGSSRFDPTYRWIGIFDPFMIATFKGFLWLLRAHLITP
jgi:hypothetical protein